MDKEQKLEDMVNVFRNRLAEEELRYADVYTSAQQMKRDMEVLQARIEELETQVAGNNGDV